MTKFTQRAAAGILMLGFSGAMAGCETKAKTGALVGGAGGAAVGAGIGSLSHSRAGEGALIGAAVGTIGGYIVGNEMDKKDQKEREQYNQSTRTAPAPQTAQVTRKQVIQWTQEGVKDDIIIDRIHQSGSSYRLRAADENELRDGGVSEDVIRAMKDTAR